MESLLQDLEEFPTYIFYAAPIVLLMAIPVSIFLRPHPPCKYWKTHGIIFLLICLCLGHYLNLDNILEKETLSSLTKQQGILTHVEVEKGQRGGFFLANKDGKRIRKLNFMLCGYRERLEPYLEQKVIVWHKKGVVYQLEVNGFTVYDLARSNEKVYLGNVLHFLCFVIIFAVMLPVYFSILRP